MKKVTKLTPKTCRNLLRRPKAFIAFTDLGDRGKVVTLHRKHVHTITQTHTCARQTHSYTQSDADMQTSWYTLSHSSIQTHTHPQCDADSLKGLVSPAFLCLSAPSDPALLYV